MISSTETNWSVVKLGLEELLLIWRTNAFHTLRVGYQESDFRYAILGFSFCF